MALVLHRVMRQWLKIAGSRLSPDAAYKQLRRIQRHEVRIDDAGTVTGIYTINTEQASTLAVFKVKRPTLDAQISLLQWRTSRAVLDKSLRPETLWVPGWASRLVQPVLSYEKRDTQVPEQLRFCHSKFESATSTAAGGAELSTATGGRRSRLTPGRRGG